MQAELKKKWSRYMLKRQGSGFSRRHTVTSFVSRASVANHCTCVDNEPVNEQTIDNGHCVTDKNGIHERQAIYNKEPAYKFDYEHRTDVNSLPVNDSELCPMMNFTGGDDSNRECVSYPMLQTKADQYDDIT